MKDYIENYFLDLYVNYINAETPLIDNSDLTYDMFKHNVYFFISDSMILKTVVNYPHIINSYKYEKLLTDIEYFTYYQMLIEDNNIEKLLRKEKLKKLMNA